MEPGKVFTKSKKTFTLRTSLRFILLSIFLFTGLPTLIWYSYENHLKSLETHPAYNVKILLQTGPEKHALSSVFFAESLNLSTDLPTNLVQLDIKGACKQLQSYPFIKEVILKKRLPDTLYIDYTLRKPFVKLADFSNTVIDKEGAIFPLEPYYSPKKLPEVYLGLFEEKEVHKEVDPYQHLEAPHIAFILKLLQALETREIPVTFIDLSQAFDTSLGKREVVLEVEDGQVNDRGDKLFKESYPKLLRLDPDHFQANLDDYLRILPLTREEAKKYQYVPQRLHHPLIVLDLRIEDLAFLSFPRGKFLSSERRMFSYKG